MRFEGNLLKLRMIEDEIVDKCKGKSRTSFVVAKFWISVASLLGVTLGLESPRFGNGMIGLNFAHALILVGSILVYLNIGMLHARSLGQLSFSTISNDEVTN